MTCECDRCTETLRVRIAPDVYISADITSILRDETDDLP